MLTKTLRPTILILLGLATHGVVQAADMAIDCRLKGGTVVQLPAAACTMEGGAPVNAAAASASVAAPAASAGGAAKDQPPANRRLAEAQKVIVDLLGKPVVETIPLNRQPEGIERAARFDGCKLMVDENLRIEYGNLVSASMDFKINSVIDLVKTAREDFGMLGKISAKEGSLSGEAVYFEERKSKGGNNISISVLKLGKDGYKKYSSHDASAFWDAPRDDLWIADEYGYVKDSGWGSAVTDKIRILLIVNSSDDAARLSNALEEVNTMCKQQQVNTKP